MKIIIRTDVESSSTCLACYSSLRRLSFLQSLPLISRCIVLIVPGLFSQMHLSSNYKIFFVFLPQVLCELGNNPSLQKAYNLITKKKNRPQHIIKHQMKFGGSSNVEQMSWSLKFYFLT